MSEETAPERIAVIWSPEARADVRAIEQTIALRILYCIDDFISRRVGNVKKLKPPRTGFRLRCGDHRVFFDYTDPSVIAITAVLDRKEAYRR